MSEEKGILLRDAEVWVDGVKAGNVKEIVFEQPVTTHYDSQGDLPVVSESGPMKITVTLFDGKLLNATFCKEKRYKNGKIKYMMKTGKKKGV